MQPFWGFDSSPPPQTSLCPSTGEKNPRELFLNHEREAENFSNSNLMAKKGKSADKEHNPCCSHQPSCAPASLDLLSFSSFYSFYKAPKQNSCLWSFLLLLENTNLQLLLWQHQESCKSTPKSFTQLLVLRLQMSKTC